MTDVRIFNGVFSFNRDPKGSAFVVRTTRSPPGRG
jgi:hypothetical protein